ncbi:hypothetical protein ACFV9C_09590 [Kribbella sp. NPDC059898]|uniref:hypothetical protein n=1 Tax=Kribbella sp. NPDC059898 TaxID=3346995 RepID=UPI00365C8C21
MKLKRTAATVASAVLLGGLATTTTGSANAATVSATAACTMNVTGITSAGDISGTQVTATSPVTAKTVKGPHLFTAGVAKAASTWTESLDVPAGATTTGLAILNDTLYSAYYSTMSGVPPTGLKKVGPGWGYFNFVEESFWQQAPGSTVTATARYGFENGPGYLHRWRKDAKGVWHGDVATGFSAVKTMALISETQTYDTFLANTRGGALYTIRIPRTAPIKPIVKKVRTSTWQTFESLVAEKCGSQGTLLTAIDKDTGAAYLYAVGHANGTATVIKGLGKVPGTFKDPVYSLTTPEGVAPLSGE